MNVTLVSILDTRKPGCVALPLGNSEALFRLQQQEVGLKRRRLGGGVPRFFFAWFRNGEKDDAIVLIGWM
jgi:hypothetical protein